MGKRERQRKRDEDSDPPRKFLRSRFMGIEIFPRQRKEITVVSRISIFGPKGRLEMEEFLKRNEN